MTLSESEAGVKTVVDSDGLEYSLPMEERPLDVARQQPPPPDCCPICGEHDVVGGFCNIPL